MRVFITGSAGFVGANLCSVLSRSGKFKIVGADDFNDYYDVRLKRARTKFLTPDVTHHELDISDADALADLVRQIQPDVVIHLAAQAGVRHSFVKPMNYARANLSGHVSVLEAVRRAGSVRRFIYASSSSVYSGVTQLPFTETTKLGTPKSLYAASKIADEILTDTYSNLFGLDAIGLRFFTVYGPWGRPDMAYWSFAESILSGREIKLFNFGDVRRDFTYIDDITRAIENMVDEVSDGAPEPQHRLYNIGNHSPEPVRRLISILEGFFQTEANVSLAPLPPGDMVETYACVDRLRADYGFAPETTLEDGLTKFVTWFDEWRKGEKYKV